MLIIEYKVAHKNHPKAITLCGRFNSLEHFKRFQSLEAFRGWYLVGLHKVLKEE